MECTARSWLAERGQTNWMAAERYSLSDFGLFIILMDSDLFWQRNGQILPNGVAAERSLKHAPLESLAHSVV
jgi:hypothetical protein